MGWGLNFWHEHADNVSLYFFLSLNLMFSLLLEYCKSLKNGCGPLALIPIPPSSDWWLYQRRGGKQIQENMGMVVEECKGGNDEMWRSRMKKREAVMRGAGWKVKKWRNASQRKNFDYNVGSWAEIAEKDWLVECDYLPGYWLLSRSWPPLRVNPYPGKLPLEVQAALSSWLSVRPCVATSLLPLKINTLPPRSSPPNGQPTATSEGWHTCTCFRHQQG